MRRKKTMTAAHKRFIRKKLIPFILREHGNGFAMDVWADKYTKEDVEENERWGYTALDKFDGVAHMPPACGTVACIGGSIQMLKFPKKVKLSFKTVARAIGLTPKQADGLFHEWHGGEDYGWPKKFAHKYSKAKTALAKAKIAAKLMEEVASTEGKCLEQGSKNGD